MVVTDDAKKASIQVSYLKRIVFDRVQLPYVWTVKSSKKECMCERKPFENTSKNFRYLFK